MTTTTQEWPCGLSQIALVTFQELLKQHIGALSMNQVAYKTGVSYEWVRKIVGEGKVPSPEIVSKLAVGLGADVDELLVAAGHLPDPDPVRRVEFALNGVDALKDYQVDALKDYLESLREKK